MSEEPHSFSPYGSITKLLTDWKELEGKTIVSVDREKAVYTDYLVFRFSDGTSALLEHFEHECTGYYEDLETLSDAYENRLNDKFRARIYFGLTPVEKYNEIVEIEKKLYLEREEAADRNKYELLKRRFG